MQKLSILLALVVLASCKTVQVNQRAQKTTKTVVELGTIGKEAQKIETNVFQTTTVPVYKNKLRVALSIVPFTDNTFNVYTKAARQQNQPNKITYIDSVANKPGYAHLKLLDQVQLLSELNADYNEPVSKYLQSSSSAQIVTSISAYFNATDLNNIGAAEEVYLINEKPQKYGLQLVKNGKPFTVIDISRGVPFTYTTASFCWKKERGKIQIASFIEGMQSCARDTYENVARLNKKVNYFKY